MLTIGQVFGFREALVALRSQTISVKVAPTDDVTSTVEIETSSLVL